MRVLLLHNYYQQRGGEDTVFESERELLRNFGHEVEDLCFDNHWIDSPWKRVKAGVVNLYNRDATRRLEEKIEQFKPDVLHVHNFFPTASPGVFWKAGKRRLPVVLTLHNFRLICARANLYREGRICTTCADSKFPTAGIVRSCYRDSKLQSASLVLMTTLHRMLGTWQKRVDRFIALSEFGRDLMLNSAVELPPNKVSVKPNFCFDRGEGQAERTQTALFIGRLVPQKGIEVMLKAFEELPYDLTILGTGPLEPMVREAMKSNPRITFMGFQSSEVVLEQLKQSKLLVFPSTWYETFGMTIIEAFSTATPVVASDHGPPSVIVEDGVTGRKFEPGSPESLREAVRDLLGDEGRRREMGLAARRAFLEHYSPEKNHERLIEIYEEAVAQVGLSS